MRPSWHAGLNHERSVQIYFTLHYSPLGSAEIRCLSLQVAICRRRTLDAAYAYTMSMACAGYTDSHLNIPRAGYDIVRVATMCQRTLQETHTAEVPAKKLNMAAEATKTPLHWVRDLPTHVLDIMTNSVHTCHTEQIHMLLLCWQT